MHIRLATTADRAGVHGVHWSAFPDGERAIVSTCAVDLLSEDTTPATISLVAEAEDTIVGHVAFSPVTMSGPEAARGYILAPLAVRPEYQRRGIGSGLVTGGIQRLSASGVNVLFVYGDPDYYGRFGFGADAAVGFQPPYRLQCPSGWQALILHEFADVEPPIRLACVESLRNAALW